MATLTWLPPADDLAVADELTRHFTTLYGGLPDGVWFAPGRVNLIGEHTDYNDGYCLPLALPHRTYAAMRWRDDGLLRLASRQTGSTWEGPVSAVAAGSPGGWAAYVAGVAAVLAERVGDSEVGADILLDGHVPLGAGLSSSAALSCSVAVGLRDLVEGLADLSTPDLVKACVRAENEFAGAATGGMDQTVSLRAVEDHALLIDCRDFSVRPVSWSLPQHQILVIDTRAQHSLADGQYAARRADCERATAALGLRSLREIDPRELDRGLADLGADAVARQRVRHVVTETERVLGLVGALAETDAARVGELMTASHRSLREDYEVSCAELDVAVQAALAAGALGARMTGGGFGGSVIALIDPDQGETVARSATAAFEDRGWEAPAFLTAFPSGPADRIR